MPQKRITQRARRKKSISKAASTQAGKLVRAAVRRAKRGTARAKSVKQAIVIGLSKARRAGLPIPSPGRGPKPKTRRGAVRARRAGHKQGPPRPRKSRSTRSRR
jgi:hypothetical protein